MTADAEFRPPGPPIGALDPRPGGADEALRRIRGARRRRAASGGVVAAATLLVAATMALVPGEGNGGRVVVVSPPPAPGHDRDEGGPTTSAAPSPTTTAPATAASPDDRPGAAPPTTAGRDTPGETAAPPGPDRAPVQRTYERSIGIECSVPPAPDWCTSAGAGDTGTRYPQLYGRVCRADSAGILTFATEQEVDFEIYDSDRGGDPLWRWSTGQRFAASAHELELESGSCFLWSVVWDATDDAGAELPDGEYWLEVASVAEEIDGPLATSRVAVAVAGSR